MNKKSFPQFLISSIFITGATGVNAQKVDAPESNKPKQSGIEEVVVNARRIDEFAQTVPVSITALSGQALQERKIESTRELQYATPSLSVATTNSASDTTYSIRGQGQSFGNTLPGVQPYFEDVPVLSFTQPLFDLQSVQVLKGPQGTLFGRNTTGGAILFVPSRPTNQLEGSVSASAGNYNYRKGEVIVNAPIVDETLLFRLAGKIEKRDGYVKNMVTGKDGENIDTQAVRGTLLYEPSDKFSNRLVLSYEEIKNDAIGNILYDVGPQGVAQLYTNLSTNPPSNTFLDALALQQKQGIRRNNSGQENHDNYRSRGIFNTTDFDLDSFAIKNILSWTRQNQNLAFDFDASPLDIISGVTGDSERTQYTEELQFSGTTLNDRLEWQAGGFYANYKKDSPIGRYHILGDTAPAFSAAEQYFGRSEIDELISKAVFAHGTFSLADDVTLALGYRKTWDDRDFSTSAYNLMLPNACLDATQVYPDCESKSSQKTSKPNWNVSLDWKVTQEVLLYLASRHGYKAGGFNGDSSSGENQSFGPEYVTDYELGAKTDWHIGGLLGRTNLALFEERYDDIQRQVVKPGDVATITVNAAEATLKGAELELTLIPITPLEISAFYSYIDASFDKYTNPFTNEDQSGNKFSKLPEDKYNLMVRYKFELGDMGRMVIFANWYRQSSFFFVDENLNTPNAVAPAYTLVDLGLDWTNVASAKVDLHLFVKNVTDEEYILGPNFVDNTSFHASTVFYGEPRTYSAELRYRF